MAKRRDGYGFERRLRTGATATGLSGGCEPARRLRAEPGDDADKGFGFLGGDVEGEAFAEGLADPAGVAFDGEGGVGGEGEDEGEGKSGFHGAFDEG